MPRLGGDRLSVIYPAEEGLGALLRRHRVRAGMSQNGLARAAGFDPAYINRIERGQRSVSPAALDAIIEALGLDRTAEGEELRIAAGYCPTYLLALDRAERGALYALLSQKV